MDDLKGIWAQARADIRGVWVCGQQGAGVAEYRQSTLNVFNHKSWQGLTAHERSCGLLCHRYHGGRMEVVMALVHTPPRMNAEAGIHVRIADLSLVFVMFQLLRLGPPPPPIPHKTDQGHTRESIQRRPTELDQRWSGRPSTEIEHEGERGYGVWQTASLQAPKGEIKTETLIKNNK